MYFVVWKFTVRTEAEEAFKKIYGPDGEWVQLFRKGNGYLGTDLLEDIARKLTYLTVDRWTSHRDYEQFKHAWKSDYLAIDGRCEGLTAEEIHIGSFSSCGEGLDRTLQGRREG